MVPAFDWSLGTPNMNKRSTCLQVGTCITPLCTDSGCAYYINQISYPPNPMLPLFRKPGIFYTHVDYEGVFLSMRWNCSRSNHCCKAGYHQRNKRHHIFSGSDLQPRPNRDVPLSEFGLKTGLQHNIINRNHLTSSRCCSVPKTV